MQKLFKLERQGWPVGATLIVLAIAANGLEAKRIADEGGPANAVTAAVHDEAMRILTSIKTTEYRHKTDIDEQKGAYYCDCSGFVGYVLNRTVPKDGRKGPLADGKSRPLAMEYEKFFAGAPSQVGGDGRWQQVIRVVDVRPGDVIAWKREKPVPGNTGHVVIVDQMPVLEKDGRVRVAIIDSTTLPSADITRDKGKSGIGRRTMWFVVDKEGRPRGYVRGSPTSKPKTEQIAIGRALPTTSAGTLPAAEKRPVKRRAA